MRLKRTEGRYGDTPVPATPYQAAGQVWDLRIGSARVQAHHWRLIAFASLALASLLAAGLVWRAGQSMVTPYVVEVDSSGRPRAVTPAQRPYQPTQAQIAFHLARFIDAVRSLSIDPVVVRGNWLRAYDYTTPQAAALLTDYARAHDPFADLGQQSVAVEVSSVVRASEQSYQVRWIERRYRNARLSSETHWTALLTIVVQPPVDEAKLLRNPLGIYIDGLSWSRELGMDAGGTS